MSTFTPSTYQVAIDQWVIRHQSGRAALVVDAVAGSGKTTTIVHAAGRIPVDHKAVFLAFNKSIASELAERLPSHVESKTINSLGFAACRRHVKHVSLDAGKSLGIAKELLDKYEFRQFGYALSNIVAKAKAHAYIPMGMELDSDKGVEVATADHWWALKNRYDIDFSGAEENWDYLVQRFNQTLRIGIEKTSIMDFDDQIYLPVVLGWKVWGYDWVIVDEAQDVSHVQRLLLKKFIKSNGRFIAVGDRRQAIYGFRGADSNSIDSIVEEFQAEELPLSICYRCPVKVVEMAQTIVPQIEAFEKAEEGEVISKGNEWSPLDFERGDLIVCRLNAPLIKTVYACIREGVSAHIMGRDIGKGLTAVIKRIDKKFVLPVDEFEEKLGIWQELEMQKAIAKNDDALASSIEDKCESLRAVVDYSGAETTGELVTAVESLFSDKTNGVTLSSVHRAKGLEADRVYLLDAHMMPLKWAKQEWQIQQEYNILYVAITRAAKQLIMINS